MSAVTLPGSLLLAPSDSWSVTDYRGHTGSSGLTYSATLLSSGRAVGAVECRGAGDPVTIAWHDESAEQEWLSYAPSCQDLNSHLVGLPREMQALEALLFEDEAQRTLAAQSGRRGIPVLTPAAANLVDGYSFTPGDPDSADDVAGIPAHYDRYFRGGAWHFVR